MAKQIQHFRCEPEKLEEAKELADLLGIKLAEVIRQSLPTIDEIMEFKKLLEMDPTVRWRWERVVQNSLRIYLNEQLKQCRREHYHRFGLSGLEHDKSKTDNEKNQLFEVVAKKYLDELTAAKIDPAQLEMARKDLNFLGLLYEAWKLAKAGSHLYFTETKMNRDPNPPRVEYIRVMTGKDKPMSIV